MRYIKQLMVKETINLEVLEKGYSDVKFEIYGSIIEKVKAGREPQGLRLKVGYQDVEVKEKVPRLKALKGKGLTICLYTKLNSESVYEKQQTKARISRRMSPYVCL